MLKAPQEIGASATGPWGQRRPSRAAARLGSRRCSERAGLRKGPKVVGAVSYHLKVPGQPAVLQDGGCKQTGGRGRAAYLGE